MSPSRSDRLLFWILRAAAASAAALVLFILFFLIKEAWPAFDTVGPIRFLNDPAWYPTEGQFNLLPMLVGSVAITLGALLLATPLGILSAVFDRFYAPRKIGAVYRQLIALFAGIPSVVYGLWGLVVLVPLIRTIHPPGPSLLAGIIILAFMILPTIALNVIAALETLPPEYLRDAAALGFSRWQTVKSIALPAARHGWVSGSILGAGRAVGETMAVLMVCGNVVQIPRGLFDPVRTLTANMALEMAYALDTHRAALFVGGLLLMSLVAALLALSGWIGAKAAA